MLFSSGSLCLWWAFHTSSGAIRTKPMYSHIHIKESGPFCMHLVMVLYSLVRFRSNSCDLPSHHSRFKDNLWTSLKLESMNKKDIFINAKRLNIRYLLFNHQQYFSNIIGEHEIYLVQFNYLLK